MVSNEMVDPTAEDAERRAERAKASLLARLDILKGRFSDVKRKLDLPSQIAMHPLPAVAIAFALGAALGLRGGGRSAPQAGSARPRSGAVATALAAFGLRFVREVALAQLALMVKRWVVDQDAPAQALEDYPTPPGGEPFVAP